MIEHCRLPGSLGGDQTELCEEYEYDDELGGCCGTNFVTKHTDARGHVTEHMYDEFGNRTHTQHRIATIVDDFESNDFGQMIKHILPHNGPQPETGCRRVDLYTYYTEADGVLNGYLKEEIVDASDIDSCPGEHVDLTTTYEYDSLGRLVSTTDPRGHDTLYEYNELDQVVRRLSRSVDDTDIRYERLTFYDANDNVVRVDVENKDATGALQDNTHFSTVYEYEILNHQTQMCSEVGDFTGTIPGPTDQPRCEDLPADDFLATAYAYDANRNRIAVAYGEAVNGNGPFNTLDTEYDERDLVFREIRAQGSADQSTTQYDYDGNRNTRRVSRGLEGVARITESVYDGYDRSWAPGGGAAVTDPMGNVTEYHYDPNGNLGGFADADETMQHPFAVRVEGELIDVVGSAGNIRLYEA